MTDWAIHSGLGILLGTKTISAYSELVFREKDNGYKMLNQYTDFLHQCAFSLILVPLILSTKIIIFSSEIFF